MRLIDGDALEKFLSDAEIEATRQRKYVFASALNTICGNVKNFPTIEPERKKGKWIKEDSTYETVCSVCHGIRRDNRISHTNFCNCCGADMREGEEE